ncbi:hypothetical protein FG386_002187 [Cryptosporidium ryanae]|uniref:uncharacterized protein n=1 Tax=Cryptosporidium ryanae TaxID=515981 RepID=UPI00351A4EFE|nr:hypothetical protein FG386_002187 [Cryptosporidium ryanae]
MKKNRNDTTIRENKRYSRIDSEYDCETGLDNWDQSNSVDAGRRSNHNDLSSRVGYTDSGLNVLENAVSQLKSVGYGIQSEIGTHLNMLGEMNSNIDSANRRIKTAQRVANKLIDMSSTMTLTIIAFLLFVLLILQLVF